MRRAGVLATAAVMLLLSAGCDPTPLVAADPSPGPSRLESIPSEAGPASPAEEPSASPTSSPSPAEVADPLGQPPAGVPDGAQQAVVERIVDGDTIWARVDEPGGPLVAGATHKVRLLEIDTPETRHPSVGEQCGGSEATAFAAERLPVGSQVWLLADREDTDRYGRFLRYVWTADGAFFNEESVRTGHARAALYEPNDAYIEQLRAAEAEAQAAGRGIWGPSCGVGGPEQPDSATGTAPDASPEAPPAPGRAGGTGPAPADAPDAAAQGAASTPPASAPVARDGCDASYPTLCLPPSPDLNCGDIAQKDIPVTGSDPHGLDGNGDGVGCES